MNGEQCAIARTPDDLSRLKTEGKKAFYIGIENGYGIGKDLKNITRFHDAGVTYITLCHTRNNDICDSSSDTTARWNGLSPYGRKVVKEMNRLGIMIDLSHAAESTFWDVLKYSKAPVIVSHSSASAIYRHDRNLTDEQLRALAAHGGVAQACLVDEFLNPDAKKTNLTDFMKHLLHMVEVAGIDTWALARTSTVEAGSKDAMGTMISSISPSVCWNMDLQKQTSPRYGVEISSG